jgi:hypothetical protein
MSPGSTSIFRTIRENASRWFSRWMPATSPSWKVRISRSPVGSGSNHGLRPLQVRLPRPTPPPPKRPRQHPQPRSRAEPPPGRPVASIPSRLADEPTSHRLAAFRLPAVLPLSAFHSRLYGAGCPEQLNQSLEPRHSDSDQGCEPITHQAIFPAGTVTGIWAQADRSSRTATDSPSLGRRKAWSCSPL